MKRKLRNITSIDTQENDIDFRFNNVELFQIRNLSQPNVVALLSHGDPNNGVTYIQGLAKIDRIVDSLTIDEQLTVKGITGHNNQHFVLDLKTNEVKFKMNDGIEVLQITDLSEPNTVSLVSHGSTSAGVIDIKGTLKVNDTVLSKAFTYESSTTTSSTQSIDCGIVNSELDIKTKLYIASASNRELITVDTSYDGSSYSSSMSYRDLHRFSGLAVAYNLSLSLSTGRHHFDLVGTGNGTSVTIKAVTNIN